MPGAHMEAKICNWETTKKLAWQETRTRSSAHDRRNVGRSTPTCAGRNQDNRLQSGGSGRRWNIRSPGKSVCADFTVPQHVRGGPRQPGISNSFSQSRQLGMRGSDSDSDDSTDEEVASLTSGRRLGIEYNDTWSRGGRHGSAQQEVSSSSWGEGDGSSNSNSSSSNSSIIPPARFRDEEMRSPSLFALVSPPGSSCRLRWPFSPTLSDRGSTPGAQSGSGSDVGRSWGGTGMGVCRYGELGYNPSNNYYLREQERGERAPKRMRSGPSPRECRLAR